MKRLPLLISHVPALAVGFALGIYALPILIAPEAPSNAQVQAQAGTARYQGQFRRDLKDSDALHWGEGSVSIGARSIAVAAENVASQKALAKSGLVLQRQRREADGSSLQVYGWLAPDAPPKRPDSLRGKA